MFYRLTMIHTNLINTALFVIVFGSVLVDTDVTVQQVLP